jgi:hypothetical protein
VAATLLHRLPIRKREGTAAADVAAAEALQHLAEYAEGADPGVR